jgi:hypothetical protein
MTTPASQARAKRFLDTFVRSEFVANWTAEHTNDGGYARPGSDDRDRYDRCDEAAENGSDGMTHAEHISDWRKALPAYVRTYSRRNRWSELERFLAAVEAEIDAVEAWHEANGSLFQEIG